MNDQATGEMPDFLKEEAAPPARQPRQRRQQRAAPAADPALTRPPRKPRAVKEKAERAAPETIKVTLKEFATMRVGEENAKTFVKVHGLLSELSKGARGKVLDELQKPFVFTYTNINTYLICPQQMYRRYVKKDIEFKKTPEMDWGNEVHSAFEYRLGGKPLPTNMVQWEPFAAALDGLKPRAEVKLGITAEGRPTGFFDKDVWLRGKADVIAITGTACFLPDWKTGKPREEPLELAVNAMLVHAHNPHLRVFTGAYVWLKEDRMGVAHDVSDTNSTWAKINNVVEEIQESMASGDWPTKKSPLCAWCDVFDCPHNSNPKRV